MGDIIVQVAALEVRLLGSHHRQAQCVLSPGWQSHAYFTTPVADIANEKAQWGDDRTCSSSPRKPLCAMLVAASKAGVSQIAKLWLRLALLVDGKAITETNVPLSSLQGRAPRQFCTIRVREELQGVLIMMKVAWAPAPAAFRKHAAPITGAAVKTAQASQQRPRSAPGRRAPCSEVNIAAAVKEVDQRMSACKRMHARCSCGLGIEAAEKMTIENGQLRSLVLKQGATLLKSRMAMETTLDKMQIREVADWLMHFHD